MDGIEILAQRTVQTPLVVPIFFTVIAAICAALAVIQLILTIKESDKKFRREQKIKLIVVLALLLVAIFIAVCGWVDRGVYNEYTVLIEDTVSFNDFNDIYEMLSHDGSGLYTVKELKG